MDSQDNVYVLTRGEHPIIVFDRDGNFIRSFGEGLFSDRTHGLYIQTTTGWSPLTMAFTLCKYSPWMVRS